LNKLKGSKLFTKLDIRLRYNNINTIIYLSRRNLRSLKMPKKKKQPKSSATVEDSGDEQIHVNNKGGPTAIANTLNTFMATPNADLNIIASEKLIIILPFSKKGQAQIRLNPFNYLS
ncbi:hypothetical protein AN958_10646, partial [Leucoagaricus sp. SymC.cos]